VATLIAHTHTQAHTHLTDTITFKSNCVLIVLCLSLSSLSSIHIHIHTYTYMYIYLQKLLLHIYLLCNIYYLSAVSYYYYMFPSISWRISNCSHLHTPFSSIYQCVPLLQLLLHSPFPASLPRIWNSFT